jgi:hypothetical protein
MSLPTSDSDDSTKRAAFFAAYVRRLPLAFRAGLGLLAVASLVVAAEVAASNYPRSQPLEGRRLEARIAELFSAPTVHEPDDVISGDFLIERFYVLDLSSGERYVADFMKGRIQGVQINGAPGETKTYMFLLDRTSMRRNQSRYSQFVSAVAAPTNPGWGYYLGVSTPDGMNDAFPVNYSGLLLAGLPHPRSGVDEDIQAFLLDQKYADVTANPRLVTVNGRTFLLSNSEWFSLFKNDYGIDRAVFVSELLIVDATSAEARAVFFKLFERYPRPVATPSR